jgi:delta(3,5)-delta(2,4)-dienoyl-CoA isomerase
MHQSDEDIARKCRKMYKIVQKCQDSMSSLEKCVKPVIVAIHNGCIGAGVDMICGADIRYCSSDAYFQIKEVDVGLAADVGTLQRLPKIVGNESLVRELAFTARKMFADEALKLGLISRVFPDKKSMIENALEVAATIAKKSPVAVQGTKFHLIYSRDHGVDESLEYQRSWNQSMLLSEDLLKSGMAMMSKSEAEFNDL